MNVFHEAAVGGLSLLQLLTKFIVAHCKLHSPGGRGERGGKKIGEKEIQRRMEEREERKRQRRREEERKGGREEGRKGKEKGEEGRGRLIAFLRK